MSTTIDVSPLKIRRSTERGKQVQETLTVSNVGEQRYSYRVDPERRYREWVDPDPELFAINPQEDRAITLNLQPPEDAKLGVHRFGIAVVNEDVEGEQVRVDVALQVPIPAWWWILLAVILVILIVLLIVLSRPG